MSLFKHRIKYTIPERLDPTEARERRLTALLERERRFSEVANFQTTLQRIQSERSPVKQSKITKEILSEAVTRADKSSLYGVKQTRQKEALIASALSRFTERDFGDAQKRNEYRLLRQAHEQIRSKSRPSGTDNRQFNPTGKTANTIYGTAARLAGVGTKLVTGWTPMFLNPASVFPCVQRRVQREVMFATKHAGKGYHTRKRRTWSSGVPC